MGARGKVGSKRSTCLYIDEEVLETARQMGLKVSKACENAPLDMGDILEKF